MNEPPSQNRRSIRLQGFDYALPGAYFITIVTYQRECLFGEVVDGEVRPSVPGRIVLARWQCLPRFFMVELDASILMPNHFHGIIFITPAVEAFRDTQPVVETTGSKPTFQDASSQRPIGTKPGTLGAIVQNFKSTSTRTINKVRSTPGAKVCSAVYMTALSVMRMSWTGQGNTSSTIH